MAGAKGTAVVGRFLEVLSVVVAEHAFGPGGSTSSGAGIYSKIGRSTGITVGVDHGAHFGGGGIVGGVSRSFA